MGRKKRKARRSGDTQASFSEKYKLYQESVQDPEGDVHLIKRIYKKRFGRAPRTLREDFSGTSAMACSWVEAHRENRAWGIDIDPEPLEWGQANNVALLSAEQAERLTLLQGDVREVRHEPVDVTVAFNFSYFLFRKRAELRRYFACARSTLGPEGLFFLDLYGGSDSQRTMTETREQDGFDYVWDQHRFNPIDHGALNYIHFEFPDGSRIQKAFRYDWRLWSISEVRELLEEAGFSTTEAYWEGTDRKTGEGNSIFHKAERAPDDPAWIAYVVGVP